MSYESDKDMYMSQITILDELIKEMKIRKIKLEKSIMIRNIFYT